MANPIIAKNVRAQKVDWLWRGRIPCGMITTVAGRPDQGKGLFAAHVAAEVSRPTARYERTKSNVKVLYSAAEDSFSVMTRPRLEAAGAALDKIQLWRFQLPYQMRELAKMVIEQRIGLIVMDPFASHLSGGISRHSDNVRMVTDPLNELLERTGCACLIVEHALKRIPQGGGPLNAIGGSGSGLPAASRAAYVFGTDPDDEERRILAPAKCNVAERPLAMAFEMDAEENAKVGDVPILLFDQELTVFDPMRLFAREQRTGKIGRPADKRADACEWLTNYMVGKGGPVPASRVMDDARSNSMAIKTLRRAAEDMGIVRNPPGGGRNCTWDLPDEVKQAMGLMPASTPEPGIGHLDFDPADLLGGDDAS